MRMRTCAALALALAAPAPAAPITTADIIAGSMQPDCLDWKVVGACLWLHCKLGRCRVRATPRIRHYLPDLVFVAYDQTGESPWRETAALATAALPWQGGAFPSMDARDGSNLRFKEVDAIGHPSPLARQALGASYLCPSQARPMFPYYLSALDLPAWRDGGAEVLRPESVTPGLREVGDWPTNSWGPVFPRTGFVTQMEDAKAAAVAAQRACDIVTQPGQTRVYVPFGAGGGGHIDEKNARWQMLSPVVQTRCAPFGDAADWSRGKTSADGSYAWNLWRQYECCMPGAGRLIGHRTF